MNRRLIPFVLMFVSISCNARQPVEVGNVEWGRNLDAALVSSRTSGKPIFALFQEVPGCAGCRQFGQEVLSNPLLVEAIETEFTPLLIHNNKGGADAEMLRRFGEPAWNYQVVRFLDGEARDIIPRRDQVWDTHGIAQRMIETLSKVTRPVPAYLRLLAAEQSPRLKQAVFSMPCFWTGEMALGQIEGVITTEAGFAGGREVTLVRFDPEVVSLADLTAFAQKKDCQHTVTVSAYHSAPDRDQKRQISGTVLEKLGMSAAQLTKVNAWLRVDQQKALSFLSPKQRDIVK